MKIKYIDIIDQTFYFPQEEFRLDEENDTLLYYDIPLMDIIEEHGTPLKLTYLPKISSQIKKAKNYFERAFIINDYKGKYFYSYCTKSSHFSFVIKEALKNDIHLETSSAFDIDIVRKVHEQGFFPKDRFIICNGFKPKKYIENVAGLVNDGFKNVVPIFDNWYEPDLLTEELQKPTQCGIRIASEEEPKFEFYTSRLGIGYKDVLAFYKEEIRDNKKLKLKMLHFFINTGIKDTAYYWSELLKAVKVYCELKKICPTLDTLNIGGGLPIKNSLSFNYDYEYMIEEIVRQIKTYCNNDGIAEPDIFTEFGSYTVGGSGALLLKVLDQKRQNDRERWNMIDSSFMTNLPDAWALSKRFVMLAVNNWYDEYERVLLGGLTCDSDDYYNSEAHANAIYMPKFNRRKKQYIGFFHTGAYQETIGGFGGLQHCLIPAPKHILIDRDEEGNIKTELFAEQQKSEDLLKILGYGEK
ncbi:MAG: arginine decarboxylase [Bacteroidetes bacterium]|nr:arginine decarboxylase [Bacteroidota bacterium]